MLCIYARTKLKVIFAQNAATYRAEIVHPLVEYFSICASYMLEQVFRAYHTASVQNIKGKVVWSD